MHCRYLRARVLKIEDSLDFITAGKIEGHLMCAVMMEDVITRDQKCMYIHTDLCILIMIDEMIMRKMMTSKFIQMMKNV